MRYDLNILWIEDTKSFYEESLENINIYTDDFGISISFKYIERVDNNIYNTICNDKNSFKIYDILFIDYSLSNSSATNKMISGSHIIEEFRKNNIDSDILFYSSAQEQEIKTFLENNVGNLEGIYIANRENFLDKAKQLINKNAKRLTSLANIRGFLMDQTSENDYTIISYILRKFDVLKEEEKNEIFDMIRKCVENKVEVIRNKAEDYLQKDLEDRKYNIKKVVQMPNELITLDLKYKIFEKIVGFQQDSSLFVKFTIDQYIKCIVKARNNLAHKKIDVCKTQQYLLYYDNINQFEKRQCPDDCSDHNNDYKYSFEEWQNIRKNSQEFSKSMDIIQDKLTNIRG